MARQVYKFLVPADGGEVAIPARPIDPIVLTGKDPASGMPAIWIEGCFLGEGIGQRFFRVVGTGCPIPAELMHVGSAICGRFVWHIYEREAA